MFVRERVHLPPSIRESFRRPVPWGFPGFSEAVYFRTYSRLKSNGKQERWADTIIRVVEGMLSIRKSWHREHGLPWDHTQWMSIGIEMAQAMFEMKLLPPGRGLWAMGTEYVYERGSHGLNNCGARAVTDSLSEAAAWIMDSLLMGVGVGFSTDQATFGAFYIPTGSPRMYQIPDTREGWVESVRLLIASYEQPQQAPCKFDVSLVRPAGQPIRGFGGIASGPEPLVKLHRRLESYLQAYIHEQNSKPRLIIDIMNAIGACVVAGGVRRSAELATGRIDDLEFINFKNYDLHPDRREIGWMSNNSVVLSQSNEFELLPQIAGRIRDNGEPGIINLINVQKYGRIGKKKPDLATLFNPCAEIPLESSELCNLIECFPTRCQDTHDLWRAMELATIYASTVSLLPSHLEDTNRVIARNRRIGVSISGIADWVDTTSISHVTMALRRGYEEHVEPTNCQMAALAGIAPSIRLTTVKPSGTISLLAGVSPGMHWPVFRHGIRRMRINEGSPIVEILKAAKVPCEKDTYSDQTLVFSFPLQSGSGRTRSVKEVSVWEQASLVAMLQREWADNAVSNTLTFSPKKEANEIERVLACFAPLIKSLSLLPDQDERASYAQPPYETISQDRYEDLKKEIHIIPWDGLHGSDGEESRFCDSSSCEVALGS